MPKSLKIAFVMDPLEKLNPNTDSSVFMIKTGIKRKHKIFYLPDTEIHTSNGETFGYTYTPIIKGSTLKLTQPKKSRLSEFDVILVRKDPPFNMEYIYMLYALELVEKDVFFINKPSSILKTNEKFSTQNFPNFTPDTLISKSTEEIKKFVQRHKKGIVIKPLDLKGGSGIFYVHSEDININELIKTATKDGKETIVAQEFLEGIKTKGDKRIMLLNGEITNALLRVPKKGDFRGNISSGASAVKTKTSNREQEICSILGPILKKQGLVLVGLDFIDEKLTEINVTSPIIGFSLYPENAQLIYEFIEKSV